MRHTHHRSLLVLVALLAIALPTASVQAEMVLSQVIVDLQPDKPERDDIEVFNSGDERLYVSAEPAEILNPGTVAQQRVGNTDPRVSGLLVSPQRIVLEPGQRRLVRIASVAPRTDRDRVYRVTIKPVAGPLTAGSTAVKVFVGYDVLVIQRPKSINSAIVGERVGSTLRLRNTGNTAVELFDGRQCDGADKGCIPMPSTRLYAGATFDVPVQAETRVKYRILDGRTTRTAQF